MESCAGTDIECELAVEIGCHTDFCSLFKYGNTNHGFAVFVEDHACNALCCCNLLAFNGLTPPTVRSLNSLSCTTHKA